MLQDDCPFMHFNKLGHPLSCHTGDECCSKLRILSAALVHFVKLRTFRTQVYSAKNSHRVIQSIDVALDAGDLL